MAAGITIDDLLAAFDGLAKPEGTARGWTTAEIAKAKGWGISRTRRMLHEADAAGILRCGTKLVPKLGNSGLVPVACYWTESPPATAKKSRPS